MPFRCYACASYTLRECRVVTGITHRVIDARLSL
jgi:rRNA maturation protein Nop10